jgi:hypothetical protein
MNKKENNFIPMTFGADVSIPEPVESVKKNQSYVGLYYDNPYQTGIINGKVLFITGSGIDIEAPNPENLLAVKEFLRNQGCDFSVNEIIESAAFDLELYNGFCFKGAWNKDKSLAFIEHIDFDKIRSNKEMSTYYYSEDWSTTKQSEEATGYKEYTNFNPSIRAGEFLFYYKAPNKTYPIKNGARKQMDFGIYPKPTYSGAIKDIMSDVEISNFHFYELKNGMKAGTLITLTSGVPAPEEKDAIESAYKNGLTNRDSAGGVMINFVEGAEEIPDIQNLNGNDLDKRYLMTEEAIRKKIFVAHSVISPSLFGLPTQGSLGSTQEMEQAYYIFVKTYVRGRQKQIEQCLNFLMNESGITGTIKLKEPESFFEKEVEEVEEVAMSEEFKAKETKNFNDLIIGKMAQMGRTKTKGRVVYEREYTNGIATEDTERILLNKVSKQTYYFVDALDETHLKVLKMLLGGEDLKSVSLALGLKSTKVVLIQETLQESGYLNEDYSVSDKGMSVLLTEGRKLDEFEVVYTYEKRRELKKEEEIIDGSRGFCRAIIKLDRQYTREEIDSLNKFSPFAKQGLDVWNYRGGWWNKNGVNIPSCRHIWKQKVIFK